MAGLQDEARRADLPVCGIGVGVPGAVEEKTGRIGPDIQNLPELGNIPLRSVLQERTGLRVAVDNDVNALCLAEWTFGQATGLRNVAMVAVGTGVGGGLILNGALVRGAGGYAGEVGHIPVELDGRRCFCGSRGCVKAYASGPDIVAQVRDLLADEPSAVFDALTGGTCPASIRPSSFAPPIGAIPWRKRWWRRRHRRWGPAWPHSSTCATRR